MIDNYLGVPIYKTKVKENEYNKIQDELKTAYELCNFSMKEEWGYTLYLSDPSFKENLITKFSLYNFSQEIEKHVFEYLSLIRFNLSGNYRENMSYDISSSWFSKYEKGCYSFVHNHGMYDISGVYYFKVPDSNSELFFRCPIPNLDTSLLYEHLAGPLIVAPEQGNLLLFPGWLNHGVKTNMADETRVSVSFNISFQKF